MDNNKIDNRDNFLQSSDDAFVFVPAENIRAIEKVIDNWEVVKRQWIKMRLNNTP